MLKETYCSYEVSKLLREKGFDEKCRGGYHSEFDDNDNPIVMFEEWMSQPYNNDFVDEGFLCSAPTQQMAMRWLREVHKIFICIEFDVPTFAADMYKMDETDEYGCAKYISPTIANCKTYEEAVEAALKYCLENLI